LPEIFRRPYFTAIRPAGPEKVLYRRRSAKIAANAKNVTFFDNFCYSGFGFDWNTEGEAIEVGLK